jgi:hypothetical protein
VTGRLLRALFVAYVVASVAHVAWVVAHEPFTYDAWNVALDTHGEPASVGGLERYLHYQYGNDNPRIGQAFTYLAYKLVLFAPIVTPLAFFALALAIVVLGLGRRPTWRDAPLGAVALGSLWFALPDLGQILFTHSYCAHYVYSAAIQLWFVIAIRAYGERDEGWLAALFGLFGVVTGLCNEHVGPALCLFGLWAALKWRRGRASMAAAIGSIAGFAWIFFAPGERVRYHGVATKIGFVTRLLQRAITGNLDIFRDYVIACAPILALTIVVVVLARREDLDERRRAALRLVGWTLAIGSFITATVFVSPKLGPRFYLTSCALLLAAFVAMLDAFAPGRRAYAFVALAVCASGYAVARTVPLYARAVVTSEQRLAILEHAPLGSMPTIESFDQPARDWWFLGDDFTQPDHRDRVSAYLGLRDIIVRAQTLDVPLGVSDARLLPHARPAAAADHFALRDVRALEVDGILDAIREQVERTPGLEQLDVDVAFVGEPPPLPRPKLLVARWTRAGFEGWAGKIERTSVGRTHAVVVDDLPPGMSYYILRVGDPARPLDADMHYTPWRAGTYWALACRADECFVIAAARTL